MTVRTRTIAATAGVVVVLTVGSLAGCQWLNEHIPAPTPDPSRATATSTETSQERTMRLDQEAAGKAYIEADREAGRLAMAGGATKPSAKLALYAGGDYLNIKMVGLRAFKQRGWHVDGTGTSTVTANGGWSPTKLGLTACEDATTVRIIDKSGNEVNKDRPRRFVQTLTATKSDGRWKITGVESKVVKTFDHESGCET